MRIQSRLFWGLTLALSLFASACTSSQQTPAPNTSKPVPVTETPIQPIKVKIAYSAYSAVIAPLWLATDEGIFKKYGLDVELIYLEGGSKSVQGLLSNEVQIALSSADAAVNAKLKGADVVAIAGCFDRYFFQLYARPGMKSVADLKGKVVAASGAGASSEAAAKAGLLANGLTSSDYKMAYLGSTSARLAALETGAVDAAVISPPEGLKASKAGFVQVLNMIEMDLPGGYCTMNARKSWVDANQEAARRFAKGYAEGIAVAKQNKAMAEKYIGLYTKNTDADLLNESYLLSVPLMKQVPYPPLQVVKEIITKSTAPEAKNAKAEDFIDTRFMKELDDNGFIAKLYNK
jgi:NitT/TauT family transport system substrate-binding protein